MVDKTDQVYDTPNKDTPLGVQFASIILTWMMYMI